MRPDGEPATVGEALRHWATATLDHIVWLELLPAGTAGVLKAFTTISPIRLRSVVGPKWALPLLPAYVHTIISDRARNRSERLFNRIKQCRRSGDALRQTCRQLHGPRPACVNQARAALFRNHYLHRISSFGR
jgi:hypothetical protein